MTFFELLEEFGIPQAPEGHHHHTQGWIQFDCPFCGRDSSRFHMGYNIQGGFVNCWRCGTQSLISVLREYTGLPYAKIKSLVDQLEDIVAQPVKKESTRGFLAIPECIGPLKDAHIRYLSKRGFHYKDIQQLWQIQGIAIAGRLSWRIFIPILHKGRVVSWTTRSLTDKGQRYISAESHQELIPHKSILYGFDYVRHAALVLEGPLDAWAIGPGAVATFGTAFTESQILSLIKIPRRVICFDAEPQAQRQARKLCDRLGPFPGETINVVLDDKDPADSKASVLKKLRKFLK